MEITEGQLAQQLDRFGRQRIAIVSDLAHEGDPDGIGPTLLLAMGSRETNVKNITGDGGHGRGWLQIDDRFHRPFLSSHRGCDSGSWEAVHASAVASGRVPSLTASTIYAISLLRDNMQFASDHGVPESLVLRFAVAAYNAGAGGALAGFREGDVDARTAHGNYSKDVLQRRAAVARILAREGIPA